ncbi:hypothetical protein AB0I27_22770 [Streptomyces sp. NPDC050597]|uniref:hypothetical protein n=1 Tax=Streptomyces sp. NPDC050597 TaxID=3157212 RepID=UPI0034250B6C
MSPFILSDADLAATTELGAKRRERVTVADASGAYAASLIGEYLEARAGGRVDLMGLIRDHAYAIDPELLAELDGFDYPAAA